MDTMTSTKIIGAACGSLLGLLLIQWVAEEVYHTHHDGHQKVAYLLEIEEVTPTETEAVTEIPFLEVLASADASKGKKVFGKCKACHKLGDGENGTGPHLFQIIGRQMASAEGFKYSSSFNELDGQWSEDELNLFLKKPSTYVRGTAMSFAGLGKVTDRANLVAYLAENSN